MRRLLALALLAAGTGPCLAQSDVASFYKDKTIRMVVGVAVGSGYDINARAVAHFLGNHIPGKPSIIVQNQAGAGGVTMTLSLYTSGPFDGTAIGVPFNGTPATLIMSAGENRIDVNRLNWIGSTNRETHVTYLWHTLPIRTVGDLRSTEVVTGAQAPGTTQFDYPVVARGILGLRFKVISGYDGTPKIHLAMESGEVQGNGATSWTTLKALQPDWVADKKVKVLLQWSLRPHPELEDVPMAIDLAQSPEDREALRFMLARLDYGRPFFVPPGVPTERVAALRLAFDATMKDSSFLEEAKKLRLDIDPISGTEVAKLIAEDAATPPKVLERLKALLASK